ncbi:Oligopeptide transporter 1 [Acorus calamus]|uniref:Oligopeptide transporter 1 n=1 Tax=Acorus calamus TaxID=4465 RepID=A0AAV9E8B3_ACOCL|nr:Oligopeptide transporter 1 [Acorus calamus]
MEDSVTAQIIGSGRNGLGIGSFSLDWTVISGYLGNPLVMPFFTLVNSMAGFILIAYIITPVAYWTNSYNAKRFPIFSISVYDKDGHQYNVSRIINENKFVFDQTAYDDYSKIYLSAYNVYYYGFVFATVATTITYVALYYGRTIWSQFQQASDKQPTIFSAEMYKTELQVPFWSVLLACGLALICILPMSVIEATTGQYIDLNVIFDIVGGYLYHGRPLAKMTFGLYGIVGLRQSLLFLEILRCAIT